MILIPLTRNGGCHDLVRVQYPDASHRALRIELQLNPDAGLQGAAHQGGIGLPEDQSGRAHLDRFAVDREVWILGRFEKYLKAICRKHPGIGACRQARGDHEGECDQSKPLHARNSRGSVRPIVAKCVGDAAK